jgi:hypothetical protein
MHDRGNAPRSALSTSRTPRRSPASSDTDNDPSGQTPHATTGAAGRAARRKACEVIVPLRPNAGRDVLGSSAGIRPCVRAGRSVTLGSSGRPGKPRRLRRKSNLEGGRSPWKERAIRCPQGCRYAIRTPLSEQRLEADGSTRKGGSERHGGTGRGDTVQLKAGGTLRRVEIASRGRGLPHPGTHERPSGRVDGTRGAGFEKRGEPQDRQWDATSPRSFARRKPSRWCETTRTERELDGWCRRPEGSLGATRVSWEWTRRGCVGGGATRSRTPREDGSRSSTELRLRTDREGPGQCADASKEMEGPECRRWVACHPEASTR